MPKKKFPVTSSATAEDQSNQLAATVETLTTQVETLTRQVEALHQILDEIREDFQWALGNGNFQQPRADRRPVVHITSMPKDPCAKNWQINRVGAHDLPPDESVASSGKISTMQAGLF